MSAQETPWACRKCGGSDFRWSTPSATVARRRHCNACRVPNLAGRSTCPRCDSADIRTITRANGAKQRECVPCRRAQWTRAKVPKHERLSSAPREPSRALHSCAGSGRGLWSDGTPYVCAFEAWEMDDDAPAVRA